MVRLTDNGCDRNVIVWLLTYQFAGTPTELTQHFDENKVRDKRFAARIDDLAKRLHGIADEIKDMKAEPAGKFLKMLDNPHLSLIEGPLDLLLDGYAVFLTQYEVLPALRQRTLNRAYGGEDYALAFLATYVLQKTGEPHYGELATLLNVARAEWYKMRGEEPPQQNGSFNQGMLSKRVARYRGFHEDDMPELDRNALDLPPFTISPTKKKHRGRPPRGR